jgi:4-amino-4-deoxy-L-arabinose transferase-like glycosyltransferase
VSGRGWTAPRGWLLGVTVLALVLRLALVLATPHYVPPARDDPSDFDRVAVSLADHGRLPNSVGTARGGPTAFRPPLFPMALAAVYRVVGTASGPARWEAGRLLEALLGAVAVGLIFLIARRLWRPLVASVAGVIAAVYPPLVMAGSSLMSESLFIPLVLGAVLTSLVHRESSHRWRYAVLTGVLIGLASLTRGNGVVLLAPIIFLVWTGRPRHTLHAARAPATVIVATLLTLAPWAIRNAIELHALVPLTSETGYALAGTYNAEAQATRSLWRPPFADELQIWRQAPGANEAVVSSRLTSIAVRYVKSHPVSLLRTAYWNSVRLLNLTGPGIEVALAPIWGYPKWLAELSVYAFWIVAVLALLAAVSGAARRAPPALWGCPLAILLSAVPFLGLTRYRLPADPFFVLLAAAGVLSLRGSLRWPALMRHRSAAGRAPASAQPAP